MPDRSSPSAASELDVVIVGAGFAGMYMLHRIRGLGLTVRVFETGDDVGGTWYWNRYPGARCDVESMQYSYSFSDELQQEWEWTERYSAQPEILRYADHVAERFDLRRDIQLETRVTTAHFDEGTGRWTVRTDQGDTLSARWLVMATGCLSSANTPDFPGKEDFAGPTYHTGRWPQEPVDFDGQRVGVIGTGSSAIQSIPIIAAQAESLTVFQRTANYSVPARNEPLSPEQQASIKADYEAFRERNRAQATGFTLRLPANDQSALDTPADERQREFEERWNEGGFTFMGSFSDLGNNVDSNLFAAEFVRRKIHEIVGDPATADLLCPEQVIGCKRLCLDTGYFETFNRPNVRLVDVSKEPIERITARGVVTGGVEHEVDSLVFATGFDAMTGALLSVDIRGRGGRALRDEWAAGPRTYLGLNVSGFPNLFTISGPGSPSVLTNMIVSIEQHVDWISDCIAWMRERGHEQIEATPEAQDAWVDHVNEVAEGTLYPTCNSWYLGANVPGKSRVFMPLVGFPPYVEKCNEVVANGYEGFALR